MKRMILTLTIFFTPLLLFAQLREQMLKVVVTPNHSDWKYKPGEQVKFDVNVMKNNVLLPDVEVRYEVSYDMMPALKKESLQLKKGSFTIHAGTMKVPGFLRCRVWARYEGRNYEGRATVAFSPENIKPVATLPIDFAEFWEKAKAENAKIPIDARLCLLSDRCTEKVNVYELNIQNCRVGSRLYGILCIPKAPGEYPALLRVPGAGVRPYAGLIAEAEKGIITLEIGIHGIPVTMEPYVYDNLLNGGLYNYQYANWDFRDEVYYKRVYLGCVRAVDYIFSMSCFDGANVIVQGVSQGGALSIVTAALDTRIKGLVAFYPALCDLNGYTKGRAGGWPHLFKNDTDIPDVLKQKLAVSSYYDVVNFARMVKVPGFYYFGYNDMVCPPTSMFAAYNTINAPKTLELMEEAAHFGYPEHWEMAKNWIYSSFNIHH